MKALLLAGVVAAVIMLSLSGIAHAQTDDVKTPVKGSSLFYNCSQKTSPNYSTVANALDAANSLGAVNYCSGFILGVIQSDPAIQLPKGVTLDDVKEVIHSYLAQHPELRYLPAAKLIEDVLVAAYRH